MPNRKALSVAKSSPSAPALATRSLDTLMRKAMSALEPMEGSHRTKAIRASAAPSGDDRTALIERRDELAVALGGSDADEIERAIGTLRAVLPSASGTDAGQRLIMAAYVSVLTPYPIWAINQVCRQYLDGSLSSGGFAPSPPEIAGHCRRIVRGFREELAQLETVLSAEVYGDPTPESLARTSEAEAAILEAAKAIVLDRWENVIRPEIKGTDSDPRPKEDPLAKLARLQAEGWGPLPVSEVLLPKLEDIRAAHRRPGEAA
jgi:hypothetical protein